MKQLYKAIAICVLSLPVMVIAAEHDMAGMGQGQPGMPGMGQGQPGMGAHGDMKGGMRDGGMGGMHGDMMSPEHLKEMQAHILLMHDLSNKILAEKDQKKQQALKDQQIEVMKSHMAERMAKRQKMGMMPPPPPPPAAAK